MLAYPDWDRRRSGLSMPESNTIRSLERGLPVLKVVRTKPTSTLQEVHAATGLPKPTLLRILHTLGATTDHLTLMLRPRGVKTIDFPTTSAVPYFVQF
jgi:hypothetical protein